MVPSEQKIFGQSILAVLGFCSNVFFWKNTDYFSPVAEQQPLLHTWSLAVEEQYYVIFPLLLTLLWTRARRWLFGGVAVMALISLAVSEWGWRQQPSANFYLLPTRAWELLMGSMLAIHLSRSRPQAVITPNHRPMAPWLAGVGFACIVGSMVLFDSKTPFPSLYALIPTLGTVLLIANADAPGLVRSVLASPPLVRIGLISYSAYLWHQPIFSLVRLTHVEAPSPWLMAALSFGALLLAYLSWRLVEQPFRHRSTMSARRLWWFLGIASMPLLGFGLASVLSQGFAQSARWKDYNNIFSVQAQSGSWYADCLSHPIKTPLGPVACSVGAPGVAPSGVLWGDSLAGSLIPGLDELLKRQGKAYVAVVSNGCAPLPGVKRLSYQCAEDRHLQFVRALGQEQNLKEVIWMGHFLATVTNREYTFQGKPLDERVLMSQIKWTMEALRAQGKSVVLVGQNPIMPLDVPSFYARQKLQGLTPQMAVSRADEVEFFRLYDQIKAQAIQNAMFVDTEALLCEGGQCPSSRASMGLLYADAGHMSHASSRMVAAQALSLLGH